MKLEMKIDLNADDDFIAKIVLHVLLMNDPITSTLMLWWLLIKKCALAFYNQI